MKLHVPLVLQQWLQRVSRAGKRLALLSMLLVMACCIMAQTNTMIQHTTIASTRFYNGQAPDLDGDGDKDFVTVFDGYIPRYYLNNGNGTFGAGVDFVPGANSTIIEVGDLDNDGDADVVSTNGRVYINNNLTFTQLGTLLIKQNAGGSIAAIKIVDINKDGKKDIVWVNSDASATAYNEIWLNNGTTGNASFVYATGFTNVAAGLGRSSLDIADVDNDNDLDIVTGGDNLQVMKNSGGSFTSSQIILATSWARFVDWDLDGDQDIFVSNTYNAIGSKIILNDGSGTFGTPTTVAGINVLQTPFLADLNGDGYTDVAMCVWGANGYIMLNSGCKFIAANHTLSDASQGYCIADFTGDGKPDIVCCGRDVAAVLWKNDLSKLSPVTPTATTPGNALLFNGINNCVSIKNDVSLNLTANYTIECWIKPTSYKFLAGLVSKYQNNNSNGYTLRMGGTAPYSGISFDGLETPTGIIELNKWNHIAAVKNGNQRTVYVNGVAYNLGTTSVYSVSSNTDSVTIGVDYAVSGRYFEGSIDEVRIWSVARTQTEILANKNTVLSQCDANLGSILRAYYRFDNGVANSANVGYNALNDLSDSGNTGLLRNYNLNGTTNWTESYAMVIPGIATANSITSNGFTARWSAPAFGTVEGYKLYVSALPDFSSYVSGYNGLSVTGTSYAVTGLQSNTRYYYKVTAEKASVTGQGAYSDTTSAKTLLSSNANLSAISLSAGTLSPVFAAATTTYSASVSSTSASITVTPTVEEAGSMVKVNGTAVNSGSASGALTLAAGNNTVTIVVTAPDGTTTKTYTLSVYKLPANIVYYQTFTSGTLSGGNYNGTPDQLAANLSVGTPQFTGATGSNYCGSNPSLDVSVPNIGSSRTMTLTLQVASGYKLNLTGISFREASAINNGSFSVTVNGSGYYGNGGVQNACPGITASGSTAMQVSGTVTIAFTATNSGSGAAIFSIDDVLITGTFVSSDATLSNLSISSGTLSPAFASATNSYAATVSGTTNSITVTPTTNNANATVKVNGNTVISGNASAPVSLSAGNNTITVVTTAEDGTTTNTYTINITKLPANIVYYQTFSSGTLSSGNYNGTPDQLAANLSVGTPQFSGATGSNYCGGNTSLDVSVPNIGSSRTMTLTLQVASGYKLNLTGISFREASAINNGSFSVTVNGSGYYGNGGVQNACPGITASGSTAMQVSGTVTIAFTATNSGSGAAIFSIDDVLITGTFVSSDATLSNLSISSGTLSPAFASATNSYTATVSGTTNSITVTPTTNNANATVKVNGNTVTSGNASAPVNLSTGNNTITVVTTAEDGTTTNTYTINITKLPANVVYYQTFSGGTLSGGNYNGTPDQLAANLSVGTPQFTGATGSNYCGSNPSLDVSVPNIGSSRTMTLTLQVASGYKLNLTGISFREASAINNGSFSVTVNGSGYYGNGGVQNACPGITASGSTAMQVSGTVTIAFTATNSGSGAAIFSIDDVLITGTFESTLGNALNLDGVNDYVKINDDNKLDLTNNYTLECWIKPESFNALGGILSKYQGNGTAGYVLRLAGSAPYSGINFDNYETAKGILETGKWYHVAAVNNAGVRSLYINGKAQTLTSGGVYTVVANTDSLVIGMDFQSRFFKGSIDEVKIYNTALTAEQVQQDMFSLTAAVPASLVAYYSFNEGVAGANNSGVTTLTDYSVNALHGSLNRFTLAGTSSNWVSSTVWNKWLGTTNAQYATATNWDLGSVPTATDNILVPASATNLPITISAAQGFHNAQIPSGVAIINSGTLTVQGNILGTGSINSINGTMVYNGVMRQTIDRGQLVDSTVTGLTINNTGGVTLAAPLQVTGVVTPTAGTLISNGNLVLLSKPTGTARIASVGASAGISGLVTVQRYIPGGRRVFRFLAHPFNSSLSLSSLTDNIDITGTGGSPLTTTLTNNPSAFGYDNANGNSSLVADPGWFGLTATSTFDANKAYRILVRGSKGQTGSLTGGTYSPDAVTLDWSGILNQGDKIVTLTNNGTHKEYTLIGNPYASPVDLSLLTRGTNINANFSVWDANAGTRGAYVTQPFATSYVLPSGGAFFTQAAANTGNTITFTEASKSAGTPANLLRNAGNKADAFTIRINDAQGNYADQWSLFHGDDYTYNNDQLWDAIKLTNPDLNFYSFSKDGSKLAIDRRPANTDTIHMGFTAAAGVYQFVVNTVADESITYYLVDTYLGTTTLLTKGMVIPVTVDGNAAASGNNRFKLVTQKAKAIAANNEYSITASPNPVSHVLNITYSGCNSNNATVINVVAAEGKVFASFNLGHVQAGKQTINMQSYAKGIYSLQLVNGEAVKTIRIIKQ